MIVNPYLLLALFSPFVASFQAEELDSDLLDKDLSEDEDLAKEVFACFIVPVFNSLKPWAKRKTLETLRLVLLLYATEPRGEMELLCPATRKHARILSPNTLWDLVDVPFPSMENGWQFFRWLWDALAPGEDYRSTTAEKYEISPDMHEPNVAFVHT